MSSKQETGNSGRYIISSAIWAGEPAVFPLKKRALSKEFQQSARYRIFFIGIGISDGDFFQRGELPFAQANVQRFGAVMQRYADTFNGKIEYTPHQFFGHVTRPDVTNFLQLFREAGKNDICVLYYTGIGVANPVLEKGFIDFLFSDDRIESGQFDGDPEKSIFNFLESVTEQTNTNLFIIADLARAVMGRDMQSEQLFPAMRESHLIFLQNCSPHKVRALNADEAPFPDNNIFSETLLGLLEADGFHYTYKELFERLVLRMSQTEEHRRPKFYAEPAKSAERKVLSTVLKEAAVYELYFNGDTSEWRLNAGMDRGIRPSSPFMETLYRIDDSVQVAVKSVHNDFSIVSKPGSLSPGSYPATLVQQAVPKIKIAFSNAVSQEQRNVLMDVVNSSGLQLLEITDHAQGAGFIIHFIEGGYALARSAEEKEEFSIKPVFRSQPDPLAFISEMEAIAKWQGILELENPESRFNDQRISVFFEIVEGEKFGNDIDSVSATADVTDPDRVILHYDRPENEWLAPAFRCSIRIRDTPSIADIDFSLPEKNTVISEQVAVTHTQSEAAAAVPTNPNIYINQLYLGNQFGIGGESFSLEYDSVQRSWYFMYLPQGLTRSLRTTPVAISNYAISRNIFEVYNYLKIFISDKPIDLKPFWQLPLNTGNENQISAANPITKNTGTIKFPDSGWHSVTIPIKITYGQKEDFYK